MGNAVRNIACCSHPRQNRKYSIVIPAAGLGTRMKKYGPKSLINVNDKDNIISRQLKIIDEVFRWYEIILVTGFQHEKVENVVPSKIKTIYNNNYENTNVIQSINLGLQECSTENVVILYGDLIFNKPSLNVPFDHESAVVIIDSMKSEEIGCNIDNQYIEQMFYSIGNKWGQITFLQGQELQLMKEFAANQDNYQCFGFEAINYIIAQGGKIRSFHPNNAKAIDIDTSLDLKKIKDVI